MLPNELLEPSVIIVVRDQVVSAGGNPSGPTSLRSIEDYRPSHQTTLRRRAPQVRPFTSAASGQWCRQAPGDVGRARIATIVNGLGPDRERFLRRRQRWSPAASTTVAPDMG